MAYNYNFNYSQTNFQEQNLSQSSGYQTQNFGYSAEACNSHAQNYNSQAETEGDIYIHTNATVGSDTEEKQEVCDQTSDEDLKYLSQVDYKNSEARPPLTYAN